MKRALAFILLMLGSWGLISPQANLGLAQLRWISHYVFPYETFAGMAVLVLAFYLMGEVPADSDSSQPSSGR
ncbi:MAG: hypothetical protein ACRD2G_01160 [Terriglobia bacterium]